MTPHWYRTVRLTGIVALSLGCSGLVLSYFFLAGQPVSPLPDDYTNPAWFQILGSACISALFIGLVLVLLPSAHKVLRRK